MENHDIDIGPQTLLSPPVPTEGHYTGAGTKFGGKLAKRRVQARGEGDAHVATTVTATLYGDPSTKIEKGPHCWG
jgi:hypothetical protein